MIKNRRINVNNIIIGLLYIFLFAISLSPLISYVLKIGNLHLIIIMLMLFLISVCLLQKDKIKSNKLFFPISIYIILVIIGLINEDFKVVSALQAMSYRVLFPILFFSIFLIFKDMKSVGFNMIKTINIICIILGIFGIIEINNPQLIYNIYGSNLTTHLNLILNGEISSRLVSLAGNPINLGFYMALGVGSAITLIIINLKKSKIVVVIEILCLILFIYIMFFTYSRSAILVTFVIVLVLFILLSRKTGVGTKLIIILLSIALYLFLTKYLVNIDAISSRINTISLTNYFENTRFIRARNGFSEGTNFIQMIFGHGINIESGSNSYVFELGYASLFFESGLIGFVAVISCCLIGIFAGLLVRKTSNNENEIYINAFFISIIVSGLAGMFVEDLYMQQPFNLFLWFSIIFLVSRYKK